MPRIKTQLQKCTFIYQQKNLATGFIPTRKQTNELPATELPSYREWKGRDSEGQHSARGPLQAFVATSWRARGQSSVLCSRV